jgi:aminopeptidase N
MLDAQNAPAAPSITHRADYTVPDWLVPDIALDFDLDPAKTRVRATLTVERNGAHDRPLRLDGDGLTPLVVRIDGEETAEWALDDGALVLPLLQAKAVIETEVEIAPAANTQLMGLYASGGLL